MSFSDGLIEFANGGTYAQCAALMGLTKNKAIRQIENFARKHRLYDYPIGQMRSNIALWCAVQRVTFRTALNYAGRVQP